MQVITLRKLPAIPRTSASRLNLRSSSAELSALAGSQDMGAMGFKVNGNGGGLQNSSSSDD